MRLYTADTIKEQLHKLICQDCEESDVCSICDYRELIDEILDASTVEAEPVKYGKWLDADDGIGCICSRCGHDVWEDTPFCPNCGARMDKRRKENSCLPSNRIV